MGKWWQDKESEIAQLENDNSGITVINARKNESGEWEYAIVRWRYHSPMLITVLSGGKSRDQE